MSDTPRVSVIIPVRDRRELLAATLEALELQTYRDFEVIVIDDGSRDGSADIAERRASESLPLRVLRTSGVGAVPARELGVHESSGEVLAFTDSDCVPREDWLAAGIAAIDKGADVVQGRTRPIRRMGVLERSISHRGDEGLFATCNVFYRREAFVQAGGFDRAAGSRLGFRAGVKGRALGFGEDTLLGWQVARSGRAAVASEAVVFHAVERTPIRELFWRAWMTGGLPALVKEAPELRPTLLRQGIFAGYRRVPVYAVLMGLALRSPIGSMVVGGALLLWVTSSVRYVLAFRGSLARRLAALPVAMAIDLVTAAGLVWGSARSRALVV